VSNISCIPAISAIVFDRVPLTVTECHPQFNQLIEQIWTRGHPRQRTDSLMGPTGAGKSQSARRIFELKKTRHQVTGAFVDVNCATLRGDSAMSTPFGHHKGAFTGAAKDRPGLLRSANGGLLFLEEVGELGLDEQAMFLRALKEKRFLPSEVIARSAVSFN
jgi:transcriptional regulatory protein RtcR